MPNCLQRRSDDRFAWGERRHDGSTVATARRDLAKALRTEGFDTPGLDARLLIAHALELDHAGLVAAAERRLSAREAARIDRLAVRRLHHEPVARILGMKEFWGLALAVTPAVLVPRPESETVVEAALDAVGPASARAQALRIADLGTGSGALLLALLSELPRACGVGTDCDPRAIATARGNAMRLGLAHRAAFVACDFGAALAGGFDLILANPPYVRTDEIERLSPEVRDFDPHIALNGGGDGLDAYRIIAAQARALLAPGARLLVEIGPSQSHSVGDLLAASSLVVLPPPRRDLGGTERVLTAYRTV